VKEIQEGSKNVTGVEKVVFPPMPFIKTITDVTNEEKSFYTGGQNCSEHVKGAYTGETSAKMLSSVGCRYVLIGHSERRAYFGETNAQLNAKVKRALEAGLHVMFCFGEQLAERKNGEYFDIVRTQLHEGLKDFPVDKTSDLVLAYEPVWAIGTGETASPAQAQEMHLFVRESLSAMFGEKAAQNMSIVYGGSCNAQNAKELFACPDVDGGLIGGASLKADEFCKIIVSFP
jgi:triosephosphate isomerase